MSAVLQERQLEGAAEFLYREALYLDTRRFDEWLELFVPDCEYWVPAWKNESETTSNPKRELSLIYYAARAGLEDRVWRVQSGRSIASKPLPRTQHAIGNVLAEPAPDGAGADGVLKVHSNFTVHQFRTKSRETEVLYGRYEHELVPAGPGGALRIRRKKIILLNDYMPAMLDFYSL